MLGFGCYENLINLYKTLYKQNQIQNNSEYVEFIHLFILICSNPELLLLN